MTSIASTRRHAITSGSSNLCKCRSATPCRLRNAARATTGSGAMTDIPHDHLGQPDLQVLVRQCGGFDKISLELWTDRANAEWQERRRAEFKTPPTSRRPR